jgi:hypothetical protein
MDKSCSKSELCDFLHKTFIVKLLATLLLRLSKYCHFSEKWNPLRNNPSLHQILVFCAFGGASEAQVPHAMWVVRGPHLRNFFQHYFV